MSYGIAVVVAVVVGLVVGLGAERLPAPPLVRTVVAALAAALAASVAASGIWLLRPLPDSSIAAVRFGLAEALITSLAVVALAVILHAFVGRIGVTTHREVIIGVLAALSAAVRAASGTGLGHALK